MGRPVEARKPEFSEALVRLQQSGENALAWSNRTEPLANMGEAEAAGTVRKALKQVIAALDDKRKEYTDPLNKTIKMLTADAKKAREPFEECLERVETLLLDFDAEKRAKAQAEVERTAKAAEKRGDQQYALALRESALDTRVKTSSVATTLTWRGRVVNLPELLVAIAQGRAPETLITLNESALHKLARAYEGELAKHVPGCESYQEAGLRSK